MGRSIRGTALIAVERFSLWIGAELHNYRSNGAQAKALLKENGYKIFDFPDDVNVDLANVYAVRA